MLKTYGLTKSVRFGGDTITLKASAGLLPLYKSYFGTDVLDDLLQFFRRNKELAEKETWIDNVAERVEAMSRKPVEELTEEDVAVMDTEIDNLIGRVDSTFFTQLFCALILNAVPPEERPPMPDALDVVPAGLLCDDQAMSGAVDLLSSFLDVKKK